MRHLFSYLFLFISFGVTAQNEVTLLIITNADAKVRLDGIDAGASTAGAALKILTTPGEHYLEATNDLSQNKGEIIQLEAGGQKILKIDFDIVKDFEIVSVADINFNIPGQMEVTAWQVNNPGQQYAYPSFYYAFEKGDEILFDITMSNQKGTNMLTVSTYPGDVIRYTNKAFVELNSQTIKVPERSIYRFTLGSNHAFARNCFLKIKRKPASAETVSFNSNVSLQRILTPVVISEPQSFYINSGSNSTFKGGKSRILLPVNLPQNTIEWLYRFSASRSSVDIDNVKNNFKLFSEISNLLDFTGTGAIVGNLAFDKLLQPPGSDFCEVILLPHEFGQAFENKQDDHWRYFQDGSRSNFKSGNVKVNCCNEGSYFLGIKNPDSFYGVNVLVEVVAITAKDVYVMEMK